MEDQKKNETIFDSNENERNYHNRLQPKNETIQNTMIIQLELLYVLVRIKNMEKCKKKILKKKISKEHKIRMYRDMNLPVMWTLVGYKDEDEEIV